MIPSLSLQVFRTCFSFDLHKMKMMDWIVNDVCNMNQISTLHTDLCRPLCILTCICLCISLCFLCLLQCSKGGQNTDEEPWALELPWENIPVIKLRHGFDLWLTSYLTRKKDCYCSSLSVSGVMTKVFNHAFLHVAIISWLVIDFRGFPVCVCLFFMFVHNNMKITGLPSYQLIMWFM